MIEATADVQIGGKYCISMTNTNDGKVHTVAGTYHEVIPNEKLIYTWQWQNTDSSGSENHPETLVTLEFKSIGVNESELILTHERFADEKTCDHHQQGWTGCIGNLDLFLHV